MTRKSYRPGRLLLLLAVDVSLIFERRAFCSYVCPVGHLLGLYALLAPFQWRADDAGVCASCSTKDCVAKKNRDRLAGRSCTSGLYPASLRAGSCPPCRRYSRFQTDSPWRTM